MRGGIPHDVIANGALAECGNPMEEIRTSFGGLLHYVRNDGLDGGKVGGARSARRHSEPQAKNPTEESTGKVSGAGFYTRPRYY